jgi:hypothetical protein
LDGNLIPKFLSIAAVGTVLVYFDCL